MASTSESNSTPRFWSPPLPPPKPPPGFSLRNPFDPDINSPHRNFFEQRIVKRRFIENNQDKSLIHGHKLQDHTAIFIESNDLSSLQEAIDEYAQTEDESLLTIFKSFELNYPNSFSFKLAKILQLHPPFQIRTEIVAILHSIQKNPTSFLHSKILMAMRNLLLHSVKVESEEILFPVLCQTIGLLADRLYRSSLVWEELLQYACDCISADSQSNNKKGLTLFVEFPVNAFQNREFWLNQGNFDLVVLKNSEFIYSMDQDLKALAYDSSISLMLLSKNFQKTDLYDSLLLILLNIIDQHGDEQVLVNRVSRLCDLVSLDDGNFFKGKYGEVFWCMIRAAEVEGASEELRIKTCTVIKELYEENVIKNVSCEEMKRVLVVAMNMLSCVVDDPLWYDVDYEYSVNVGLTDAFYLGIFLFNSLSLDGDEGVFVPTAIEIITVKYASKIDWQLRHAALLAIGWIAERNFKG
ncbi:ran-binding protein, partial [Trifolium pratense]